MTDFPQNVVDEYKTKIIDKKAKYCQYLDIQSSIYKLDSKITQEKFIELIKKNSRNFAKRQYTFYNHQMDVKWFDVNFDDFNKTIEEVYNYIEQ